MGGGERVGRVGFEHRRPVTGRFRLGKASKRAGNDGPRWNRMRRSYGCRAGRGGFGVAAALLGLPEGGEQREGREEVMMT